MPLAFPLAGPLAGPLWSGDGLTPDEADTFGWLRSLWPPGSWSELYDVDTVGSDPRRYFLALAQAFTRYGTGLVDYVRAELSPATCADLLGDWERALALPATRLAPTTTAARQAAVVSRLRESGSYSRAEVAAVVGVLLGYADPSQLVTYEVDRSALNILRAWRDALDTSVAIVGGGTDVRDVVVTDGGRVSTAGVQVTLAMFTVSDPLDVTVTLTAPDGEAATWSGVASPRLFRASATLTLRSLAHVGARVRGVWRLTVDSAAGDVAALTARFCVDGALRVNGHDGPGTQVYYWGVYSDPLLEAVAGPSDRFAAQRAVDRVQPAHTRGTVLTVVTSPAPGALVPGMFLPNSV